MHLELGNNKSIFRCHCSNVCFYLPCWISKYKGSFGVFCYKVNFALPIVNFPQYYVVVFFHLKLFLFPLIFIEHRNSTNWNRDSHTHTELLSPLSTFQSHTMGPYTHIVHLLQMGITKKEIRWIKVPPIFPPFLFLFKKKITRHGASSSFAVYSSSLIFFFFVCNISLSSCLLGERRKTVL